MSGYRDNWRQGNASGGRWQGDDDGRRDMDDDRRDRSSSGMDERRTMGADERDRDGMGDDRRSYRDNDRTAGGERGHRASGREDFSGGREDFSRGRDFGGNRAFSGSSSYGGRDDDRSGREDRDYGRNQYGDQPASREMSTGQFAGRGPKGYKRSDDRIREDVCEALTRHGDVDASEIEVKVENGEVTLTGTVSDRQQKRLAEDCVDAIRGIGDVHNQLRVSRDDASQGTYAAGRGMPQKDTTASKAASKDEDSNGRSSSRGSKGAHAK
jgi:osmotically-inducible protein OsmY